MGKIVISENVSLDGVVQDPTGDEGFKHGGWFGQITDHPEVGKLALDEALGAEALLLGRRSYEFFAVRWQTRSGDLADRLNSLPKYVISTTLNNPAWSNSTVLAGEAVSQVSKLKQELDGEILVLASFQLVHALIEHNLADEFRLKVFPVVLGAGERLFGETSDAKPVRLVDRRTIDEDVAVLIYEQVRENEREDGDSSMYEYRSSGAVARPGSRNRLFEVRAADDLAQRRDVSVERVPPGWR